MDLKFLLAVIEFIRVSVSAEPRYDCKQSQLYAKLLEVLIDNQASDKQLARICREYADYTENQPVE